MVKYRLLKISMIAVLSVSSSALRGFSTIGNRRCSTTRLCDHSYSFLCQTSDALETIGKRLSSVLSAGDVVFLRGNVSIYYYILFHRSSYVRAFVLQATSVLAKQHYREESSERSSETMK